MEDGDQLFSISSKDGARENRQQLQQMDLD